MRNPLTTLLGTMYFVTGADKQGKPASMYKGVIVGFVVRKDDGTEYEVRKDENAFTTSRGPLTWNDMKNLVIGQPVELTYDGLHNWEVARVFYDTGDVVIQRADKSEIKKQIKYHQLKRAGEELSSAEPVAEESPVSVHG